MLESPGGECRDFMNLRLATTNKQEGTAAFTLVEVLMSFVILILVMTGLIYGYGQINRMALWSSWSLAAQSIASQGLERARSAQWNESNPLKTTGLGTSDEWPDTTNSTGAIVPYLDTNCWLDVPCNGTNIYVTNYITIKTVCDKPPLRMIRSDCVWCYPLNNKLCTNTVISLRAPDQ